MKELNTLGQQFVDALNAAATQNDIAAVNKQHSEKVHVTGAGRTLTFAYEQLRNAAEYAEDHLLQYAIKRFFKRVFLSRDEARVKDIGEELIIELTLAGYLQNDSVTMTTIDQINTLAVEYFLAYTQYSKEEWTLGVLAVEVEQLLVGDLKREVFAQFAYDYFLTTIKRKKLFGQPIENFEIVLFVAVNRALLKSDPATVRTILLRRYQQKPISNAYKQTNEMIDQIMVSKVADKVYRLVNRQSAPFRILWRFIDEHENAAQLISSHASFLSLYDKQVEKEYTQINKRINKGVLKSVIFLIITKVLVGVAIEVPYDFVTYGMLLWLPLTINLLFPPVYMVLLRFTLQPPGATNAQALTDSIENLLYGDKHAITLSRQANAGFGLTFNVAYAVFSVLIFGGVAWWLVTIGFALLHLLIFFTFLSAASFLGFRLSRQIRELEVVEGQQSGITMIRDFFYIPFVVVGQWISDKYARVNFVALALDILIELPLKTTLRLIRQWGMFISNKKDEL
jgi:hypothetical protein